MAKKFEFKNLKEVNRKFAKLDRAVSRRINKSAARAGSVVLQKEVKKRAPEGDSGLLKQSITFGVRVSRGGKVANGIVGVSRKTEGVDASGKKIKPSRYHHLLEFGTSRTPARPYFRPAFKSKGASAKKRGIEFYEKASRREIAKLSK